MARYVIQMDGKLIRGWTSFAIEYGPDGDLVKVTIPGGFVFRVTVELLEAQHDEVGEMLAAYRASRGK